MPSIKHISFAGLILLPFTAAAHMVPVYPNYLTMRVEDRQLVIEARVSAPFWIQDLFGGQAPPASHWSSELRSKTRSYWDQHAVFKLDGTPLTSELKDVRFTSEFWEPPGRSQLLLTFHYPLPQDGQSINGRLTLYEEDLHSASAGSDSQWISYLLPQGGARKQIAVPIEQPDFIIPITELIQTPAQRWWMLFKKGLTFWQVSPAFVLLSAGILLLIASRRGVRISRLAVLPASLLLGIGSAAQNSFHLAWFLGASLALLISSTLLVAGLLVYERRLRNHSESRSAILFRTQTHFLGLLSVGFGIYLQLKGLHP